jgi:hypothetical protein
VDPTPVFLSGLPDNRLDDVRVLSSEPESGIPLDLVVSVERAASLNPALCLSPRPIRNQGVVVPKKKKLKGNVEVLHHRGSVTESYAVLAENRTVESMEVVDPYSIDFFLWEVPEAVWAR